MQQNGAATMTWELLRLDLPNCATIPALALVPIVSEAYCWLQPTEQAAVSASWEPETTLALTPTWETGSTAGHSVFE